MENWEAIYRILDRIIHIPMHQYARYFERFTQMAVTRPITDLLPEDIIATFRDDVMNEPIPPPPSGQAFSAKRTEMEIEREIRLRIHNFHLEIYQKIQTETTKRWAFESEIKRPYFHVRELDEAQLVNWRKYLDFEEIEGNFKHIQFLYERCLVTCALYEEFWLRYARWMSAQVGRQEEVRLIYFRGSTCFAPMCRLSLRFQFALFEEAQGNLDFALGIYQSILDQLPGNLEAIMHIIHLHRRQDPKNYEKLIAIIKEYIDNPDTEPSIRGSLFAEWARVLWKFKGSPDDARALFQENVANYRDNRYFWINYLRFEMAQPVDVETEKDVFKKIYNVITLIRTKSHLPPLIVKDLSHLYMEYLLENATSPGVIQEYCRLDREVNGPWSIQTENKLRLTDNEDIASVEKRLRAENGHPGLLITEEDIRDGRNPYDKYFEQQGEIPPAPDSSANGV
ncbi:Pre-mRNA-processing factor 39 [Neolecta irregularis DAH-3]|uniref:Pre-mRNA-processing factor 39 n=1 Tax=Neolecta irregularis (strain DAH-3) TaxID=1198029 RepID=A0A1U7LU68_NEOID|nr:Pre-mRNA-processing factor 39 [Neolecta irregularis DAH-3]|eukprot:OLL26169.1 Pre-mRNA-processing factor 39 [Neolecta irregularis DAH-3]